MNAHLKSISRMKLRCIAACTVILWAAHISFLVSLPVSDETNAEKTIAGSMRLARAYTRGQSQWYRIFVGESQMACSPSGYNACDMDRLIEADGEIVTATYIEQRATLLQPVQLIVELATAQKVLLSRNQQTALFQTYNASIASTNIRAFTISLIVNIILVLIISLYDSKRWSNK